MRIIIASTYKDAKKIIAICRIKGFKEKKRLVATEWSSRSAFEEENVEHIYAEDYLKPDEFMAITKRAFEIATAWYKDSAMEKGLRFSGVSLGMSVEHQMYYYLIAVMKAITILENIIKKENPREIIAIRKTELPLSKLMISDYEYPYERALRYVAERHSVKVLWVQEPLAKRVASSPPVYFFKKAFVLLCTALLSAVLRFNYLLSASRMTGKKKAAFMAYGVSIPRIYNPVLKELEKKPDMAPIVLAQKAGIFNPLKLFNRKNITYAELSDFLTLKERVRIGIFSAAVRRKFLSSAHFEKHFGYNGYSLVRLERYRFEYLFMNVFPHIMRNLSALDYFISKEKIGLIIVVNEALEYFRSAIQLANKKHIPSLILLHGAPSKKHEYYVGKEPLFATRMATYGQLCDETLISQGISEERLVPVGNPQFDLYYPGPLKQPQSGMHSKFGLDPEKKTVVYVTDRLNKGISARGITFFFREREKMVKSVIEAFNDIEGAQLVFKASPGDENILYLEHLIKRYSHKNVLIFKNCDLPRLLRLSDAIITFHSTVALDAMILKKPVLIINFSDTPDRMDYVKYGAALGAYNENELTAQVKKILFDENGIRELVQKGESFVNKYLGVQDGKASSRAANLINDMMTNIDIYKDIIGTSIY